jgi:heme-degrading monooxygenase HmoA
MPIITTDEPILTVINLFSTDSRPNQDFLLDEMRKIVDSAAFPGWISSTVHSGLAWPGTANFIQWRSGEDLEARYAGDVFRHRTVPLFEEKTKWMKLLRTEAVFTQRHPSLGEVTEISPQRDDYTVIDFFAVRPQRLDEVVDTLGPSQEWLVNVPGYRSHSVLRGLGARGYEGQFAVMYSQWASKDHHDAYRGQPESTQHEIRRSTKARLDSLITSSDWNSYRVVHTRSASLQQSS